MKAVHIILLILVSAVIAVSCGRHSSKTYTKDMNVLVLKDRTQAGVRTISVKPSGVCSTQIDISVKDGIILNVTFTNGCSGNTQGVSRLIEGMTVTEAISRLEGIDCSGKGTSCPDQLSKALKLFL